MERFIRKREFSSLSVQDLLEARDLYHADFANLPNVVGSAIGRYRIRVDDKNLHDPALNHAGPNPQLGPRTLANSRVVPHSWPAVLVFVSQWESAQELAKSPENFVPPRLTLSDGRIVPTCVILVTQRDVDLHADANLSFPSDFLGGNYPVFMDAQDIVRRGTVGCLATDGTYMYGLTSRHVVGDPGTELYTVDRGQRRVIGTSYVKSALHSPLQDLYPGFAEAKSMITLDAGLIRIDEPDQWTCQVFGVGQVGAPININADTMSLDLIGCPVFSRDTTTRKAAGEIHGLFYRYTAIGKDDFVAELLIGPRANAASVDTLPGDSGSVWFWDSDADSAACETEKPAQVSTPAGKPVGNQSTNQAADQLTDQPANRAAAREYRPLGIQWGGLGFFSGNTAPAEFALASTIGAVCNQLNVEVMRGWNIGHNTYWGKTGHYQVAASACTLVTGEKLAALFTANADRISVSDDDISSGNLPSVQDRNAFVALADVADLVWRYTRKKDEANHFADMDQPGIGQFKGQTLLQLWDADPESRKPSVWTQFYDSVDPSTEDKHRGALPFRVREMYAAMVGFIKQKDLASFICAAGTLAHYIGDACQPLHISYLHHGHPDNPDENKVHSVYETAMLDRFAPEVVSGVAACLDDKKVERQFLFVGGDAAADFVVQLMKRTIDALSPETVVDSYVRNHGRDQLQLMWKELGDKTIDRLADGALTLATVWQSAWEEAGGSDQFQLADLKTPISEDTLKDLYSNSSFVESNWLKDMPDDIGATTPSTAER